MQQLGSSLNFPLDERRSLEQIREEEKDYCGPGEEGNYV